MVLEYAGKGKGVEQTVGELATKDSECTEVMGERDNWCDEEYNEQWHKDRKQDPERQNDVLHDLTCGFTETELRLHDPTFGVLRGLD